MNEETAVLVADGLTLARAGEPRPVLADVSLTLHAGETLTLLGENASGRGPLVRLIAGQPDRGLRRSGKFRLAKAARGAVIGAYLPGAGSGALDPAKPLASQLTRVLMRRLRIRRPAALDELGEALAQIEDAPSVSALAARPRALAPHAVAFALAAAALAQKPRLVVADDAAAGLAPPHAAALLKALGEAQKRIGFALFYATGDPRIALRLGGAFAVLRDGALVDRGPVERLASEDAHPYTRSLYRSAPLLGTHLHEAKRTMRSEPLLQVRSFGFEAPPKDSRPRAGDTITFELRRSASLALAGEEGSGRRALMRAVLGLERAPAGRIIYDAVDTSILSEAMLTRLRRRFAFVTGDDRALDPRMTVRGTIEEPLRVHLHLPRANREERSTGVLKRVGLEPAKARARVAELSVFDRRRLQIARAMATMPQLVVIDEPLAGLDAPGQGIILDLLREFRAKEGPAFLIVTADFTVAEALAQEVLVLKDRRVVERGNVADVLKAPQDDQTKRLIAALAGIGAAGLLREGPEV